MSESKQKVICIGSTGKDIFLPVSLGTVIDSDEKSNLEKKFCFDYGGKVHVEDRFTTLGGCACNISVGLARLDIDVSALGNVGDDSDSKWITTTLADEGVDVKKVQSIDTKNTDLSVIIVDTNTGERTIFVNRDVGEKLKISSTDINGFDWCFVGSLYGDSINDNMKVIHEALSKKNIKLAYNPGGKNIAQDEGVVLDLLHHANIVFVNKSEARKIVAKFDLSYNKDDLVDEEYLLTIIREHMQVDDGIVILTDGRRGAWVYSDESVYHTEVIDKLVHDATGAGDAFASGVFAGVLHDLPIEQCIGWGSVNSDAVIDYYGAQKGLKNITEIKEKINLFEVENKKIHNEPVQ